MNGRRPLLIGLTGNISTGKSTVARMLAELGAEVIDADRVAHEVMRAGTPAHARIVEAFGPQVLAPDGEIDRARLGAIVFADPGSLARLESIVHPATLAVIDHRITTTAAQVVVVEAIKLIEAGMADACASVWVTTCRQEQQVARLVQGRGSSRAEAEQRVRARFPGLSCSVLRVRGAKWRKNQTSRCDESRQAMQKAWPRSSIAP
jgi:dephospho-CoA kinase